MSKYLPRKPNSRYSKIGFSAILSVVLLLAGILGGFSTAWLYSQSQINELNTQLSEANSKIDELEDNLTKYDYPKKITLSDDWIIEGPVIPMMGQHAVNPDNMPLGPILLLGKEGSLIGIEYMFTKEMMDEMGLQNGEETILTLQGLPVSIPELGIEAHVQHINIEYLPQGHEGFTVPHYDIHIYFVDQETIAKLTT